MSLRDRIPEDLKAALRGKNTLELTVLRMLQSAIKNREIENNKQELSDEEVIRRHRHRGEKTKGSGKGV